MAHRQQKVRDIISSIACLLLISTVLAAQSSPTIAAERRDHVLRVAATDVPAALGNPFKSMGATAGSVWDLIFDCLIRFDQSGAIAPGLATRWENPNPTTWRFHLRNDAKFFSGAPVDAAAIVKTIEILKSHPEYPITADTMTIARVVAIDAQTVEIVTAVPDAILPRRLALVRIVDPAIWEALGPDGFARTPGGSGPYQPSNWGQTGGTIVLKANASSWRAPKSVSQLDVTILKDATTRVQALLSGQVDVALSLNPDDISPLQTEGFGIYVSKNGQVQVWALPNLLKPNSPLNDVRVRQAMNYAVDKAQMATTLLSGIADPASQGGTPNAFGYNSDIKPYSYDPERSRKLLKEAGYPQGFSMIADVVVGLGPADTQIHQKAASDLGNVGIRVELRTTPYTARPGKFYGGLWGDADAFSTTWNSGLYRDVIRSAADFACTKPNPFFCDEEITALVTHSQTLMDPKQREQTLKRIMQLNHEKASSLWLVEYNTIIGLAPRVLNFATRSTGMAIEDVLLTQESRD